MKRGRCWGVALPVEQSLHSQSTMKLSAAVREFQTRWVRYALIDSHGNIRQAAAKMGKSPATLDRWVRLLELEDFARHLRRASNRQLAAMAVRTVVAASPLLYSLTLGRK